MPSARASGCTAAYNCVGCHAHGGGGIGPRADGCGVDLRQPSGTDLFRYRAGPPERHAELRGKIPDYQVWELVAYVRSLSGQLPSDVAPSRSDEMAVKKAEQARKKEHPADENPQKVEHAK